MQFNDSVQQQQQASEAAGGAAVLFLLVIFAFSIAATVFWIWSIVDAAKRPDHEWSAIGQSKVVWIVLIVFFGALVSVVYAAWPRPKLKAVAATVASGAYPPGPSF